MSGSTTEDTENTEGATPKTTSTHLLVVALHSLSERIESENKFDKALLHEVCARLLELKHYRSEWRECAESFNAVVSVYLSEALSGQSTDPKLLSKLIAPSFKTFSKLKEASK